MRSIYCIIVVMCSMFSNVLLAQDDSTKSSDRELFVWGGSSYPYLPSEFKDIWKQGWNAGVGFGYSFTPGDVGYGAVFGTVEYNRFPFNETGYRSWLLPQFPSNKAQEITSGASIARGTTKILTVMANFKGSFSSTKQAIAPYFLIAVGYMYATSDSIAIAGNSSYTINADNKSAFAWSVGVGIEVPVGDRFAGFIQGKSVIGVFDRTRQFFPVNAGIRIRI